MGKVFKKVIGGTIGNAIAGVPGAIIGASLVKDKKKSSSSGSDDTAAKTKALEEEQRKMRQSLFALQERQRASDLQQEESTLGNPLSRW